jgi:hypothetical protein
MYRHNVGVWAMSITCSACFIRGEGICLHLTAGEKWLIDNQINGDDGTGFNDYWEREDTGKLYSTAYGLVSAEELNKIEREVNY